VPGDDGYLTGRSIEPIADFRLQLRAVYQRRVLLASGRSTASRLRGSCGCAGVLLRCHLKGERSRRSFRAHNRRIKWRRIVNAIGPLIRAERRSASANHQTPPTSSTLPILIADQGWRRLLSLLGRGRPCLPSGLPARRPLSPTAPWDRLLSVDSLKRGTDDHNSSGTLQ
jgi:hypothetical protein